MNELSDFSRAFSWNLLYSLIILGEFLDTQNEVERIKKINIAQKDTNSVVSVNELNEMKNSVLEKPKKSRRKPKSERNTISLNFN